MKQTKFDIKAPKPGDVISADTIRALVEYARNTNLPRGAGEYESAGETVSRKEKRPKEEWFFAKPFAAQGEDWPTYSIFQLDDVEVDDQGVVTLLIKKPTGATSAVIFVVNEKYPMQDTPKGGQVRLVSTGTMFRCRVDGTPPPTGGSVGPAAGELALSAAQFGFSYIGEDASLDVEDVHIILDGGRSTGSTTGELLGAWTLSEHDPITGDTIKTWYRGPSWQAGTAKDWEVMVTSDGNILTIGETNIGKNNGVAVLYDDANGGVIWYADDSILAAPVLSIGGLMPQQYRGLIETDDGFYWVAGGNNGSPSGGSLGRINPSNGEFTHRVVIGTAPNLFPCPVSGCVICVPGGASDAVKIFDDTASAVATYTGSGASARADVDGSVVAVGSGSSGGIATRSSSDLSAISSRTELVTWGTIGDVATDGTNVYFMSSAGGFRAILASNLATDVWNVAHTGTNANTSVIINHATGELYTLWGSGNWTLRKHNPATGATIWTTSTFWTGLGTNSALGAGPRISFGSDFIVLTSPQAGGNGTFDSNTSYNVICFNEADGTERWRNWDGDQTSSTASVIITVQVGGVFVTDDDRVFVTHDRKQQ